MTKKITSPMDLNAIRDQARAQVDVRSGAGEIRLTVHMGTCGIAAGARDVLAQLADELGKASVQNVTLQRTGCLGLCDQEPMMTLSDKAGNEYRYGKLDRNKVSRIVREHVLAGSPVVEYLIRT